MRGSLRGRSFLIRNSFLSTCSGKLRSSLSHYLWWMKRWWIQQLLAPGLLVGDPAVAEVVAVAADEVYIYIYSH